jgi:hypothetical protein
MLATEWRDYLDTSIKAEELQAAGRNEACNETLGRSGNCLDFFMVNWETIKDDMLVLSKQMYLGGGIMGP